MALISIIVPVFNVEHYIEDCLASLINQTLKDIEVLIIDDGSSDSSRKICDNFGSLDNRIKCFHRKNEGVAAARNFGLEIAKGDFLMFVDSDDWIDIDTCEIALKLALKYKVDVLMWSYIREYPDRSIKKIIDLREGLYTGKDIKQLIHRRIIGLAGKELRNPQNSDALAPVCLKMYRKELLKNKKIHFVSTKLIGTSEDALFNLELFSFVERFYFINQPLYHYRKEIRTTLTIGYKPWLFERWQVLHKKMGDIVKRDSLGPDFNDALKNRVCLSMIGLGLNELNSSNLKTIIQKIKFLKKILETPEYLDAYSNLTFKYFPVHWYFFFLFCKKRFGIGVCLMLYSIKFLRNRI